MNNDNITVSISDKGYLSFPLTPENRQLLNLFLSQPESFLQGIEMDQLPSGVKREELEGILFFDYAKERVYLSPAIFYGYEQQQALLEGRQINAYESLTKYIGNGKGSFSFREYLDSWTIKNFYSLYSPQFQASVTQQIRTIVITEGMDQPNPNYYKEINRNFTDALVKEIDENWRLILNK